MSKCREILTLQFGNYSNYIGAHWWNLQEAGFSYDPLGKPCEIENDVLFREGVNHNKQTTYTPRLLLVEQEGALGHLPKQGELYGNSIARGLPSQQQAAGDANAAAECFDELKEQVSTWDATQMEVQAQQPAKKSQLQEHLQSATIDIQQQDYKLWQNVENWSDFLYARYHPRTINTIHQYRYSPEKQTFDTHSSGVQLWKSERFEEDFCDKIRQYVEECDFLQGFHSIFDCFNGHAGLATQCLAHLNEEYGKASLAIPVYMPKNIFYENADEAMSDSIRVVNSALCFQQLITECSMFVPLSTQHRVWRQLGKSREFANVGYQADNLYQTSGILAAYLDSITLGYRLKHVGSSRSLAAFCSDLTNYDRRLCNAAMALPFAMQHNEDLIDCLDKFEGPLYTSLTPHAEPASDYTVQSLSVRGIPIERLKRPLQQAQKQMQMAAYKCESVSQMFQLYLQCSQHASMAHVSSISAGLPTRLPYPREIFAENLNKNGFLNTLAKRAENEPIDSIPLLATVQCSSQLGDTLETLHREAKRIKIVKLHRFLAAGLERDDYSEALEALLQFKDNYEDNFEL